MDKAKVKSKKESLSKTISSSVFNEPPGAFETYYRRNAVMPQPDFDDDDEEEDELSLVSFFLWNLIFTINYLDSFLRLG